MKDIVLNNQQAHTVEIDSSDRDQIAITNCVFMADSAMNYIPKEIFETFPNIKMLMLNKCGLTNLQKSYFKSDRLEYLTILNETLYTLQGSIFGGATELKYLNLAYNQIIFLEEDVFARLDRLEGLYLYNNEIAHLSPNIFKDLVDLKHLFLDNNKLEFLAEGLLSNNRKLERITLHNNQILTIPDAFLDQISKLKNLTFSGNQCVDQDFTSKQIFEEKSENCSRETTTIYNFKNERQIVLLSGLFSKAKMEFYSRHGGLKDSMDEQKGRLNSVLYLLISTIVIASFSLVLTGVLVTKFLFKKK